jgi:hypothetical protein
MLNIVQSGDYVKFIELKYHKIFRVIDINKKTGNVFIQCQHCNMKIHGVKYYLMEMIPKPKDLFTSQMRIKY